MPIRMSTAHDTARGAQVHFSPMPTSPPVPDWDNEPDHYSASAAAAVCGISPAIWRARASDRKFPRLRVESRAAYAREVVRAEFERRYPPEGIATRPRTHDAESLAVVQLAEMARTFNERAAALEEDARRKDEDLRTAADHAAKLLEMVTARDAELERARAEIARLQADVRRPWWRRWGG